MSEFNEEYADSENEGRFPRDASESNRLPEHFVDCPEIFLAHLTPEQYKARQQLYQVAYERAQAQVSRKRKAFVPPFVWTAGDGI